MTTGSEIRAAREARGWKQSELARAVGTSQQNIDRIEKGVISHSRSLPKICEALGLAPAGDAQLVPLVGYVGAGAEVLAIDDHEKGGGLEEVERPHGAGENTVAVRVRGDSMRPAYRDGDTLYYDQQSNGDLTHLVGHDCVIKLADGRCFVKEIRLTGGRFWLHSHAADPMLDVSIAWAAKVKWVLKA